MNLVVTDACPVIFLAKLDRLALDELVSRHHFRISAGLYQEVLRLL